MFCERIHQKMMLFLRRKLWKRQLKGISPGLIDISMAEIDKLLRGSLIEKSLQDIYASSQMRGQGEDFCVRGMLWLREYKHIPPFPFKGFFWENMPPKDTDWYWALHAFSFFSGLVGLS